MVEEVPWALAHLLHLRQPREVVPPDTLSTASSTLPTPSNNSSSSRERQGDLVSQEVSSESSRSLTRVRRGSTISSSLSRQSSSRSPSREAS